MRKFAFLLVISSALLLSSCTGREDPRSVVKRYANAVLNNDSTAIDSLVDWNTMVKIRLNEMSPEDSIRALVYHKQQFYQSLIDSGTRRLYYLNSRIIIGKGEIIEDRAEVEVSFIDNNTAIQNYTKIVLEKNDVDGWKIIYFY